MASECIAVSQDMVALVGRGAALTLAPPDQPVTLAFDLGPRPGLRCRPGACVEDRDVALLVAEPEVRRIFGAIPPEGEFHLSHGLRQIALSIRDCDFTGAARTTYRLAKSIELLCETLMTADALLPIEGTDSLSLADSSRLMAARRLIDEQWQDKLTIDLIARTCGLNRVKLTKGFRALFRTSVAEAIAERRLDAARQMLRTTDHPVSTVGYRSGYLNNASFARAFARRFGVSPSHYRAAALAA